MGDHAYKCKKKLNGARVVKSFRIDAEYVKWLDEESDRLGLTPSELLRCILANYYFKGGFMSHADK